MSVEVVVTCWGRGGHENNGTGDKTSERGVGVVSYQVGAKPRGSKDWLRGSFQTEGRRSGASARKKSASVSYNERSKRK